MALQTQVRLRSRGNPLFRRHGTLCRDRRRGGIKPRAKRMLGVRMRQPSRRATATYTAPAMVSLLYAAHTPHPQFSLLPSSPVLCTAYLAQLLDRSHSTDLWQLIIVTTVHPLSRFNPGAPGAHCVHGLVAHLEPPLENHLNHLPRHRYAEVLKGHPCTPSCTVYFRSSFVAS